MAKEEKIGEDEAGNCYLWSFAIPRVPFLGPLTKVLYWHVPKSMGEMKPGQWQS